jgi:hypothetical protein
VRGCCLLLRLLLLGVLLLWLPQLLQFQWTAVVVMVLPQVQVRPLSWLLYPALLVPPRCCCWLTAARALCYQNCWYYRLHSDEGVLMVMGLSCCLSQLCWPALQAEGRPQVAAQLLGSVLA